jgi:hypothetical protein
LWQDHGQVNLICGRDHDRVDLIHDQNHGRVNLICGRDRGLVNFICGRVDLICGRDKYIYDSTTINVFIHYATKILFIVVSFSCCQCPLEVKKRYF